MSTVKTAISLEQELFDSVEEIAKQKHQSRSKIISQAISLWLSVQREQELSKQLDRHYDKEDDETIRTAVKAQQKLFAKTLEPGGYEW